MGRLFQSFLLAAALVFAASTSSASPAKTHRHVPARTHAHAKFAVHARSRHGSAHGSAHASVHASAHARAAAHPVRRALRRPAHPSMAYRHASVRRVGSVGRAAHVVPEPVEEDSTSETASNSGPDTPTSDKVQTPTPSSLRNSKVSVPSLRGSRESLVRQNERTEAEGLERIEDSADLNDRIANGLLVPVPASSALTVNASLPQELRYCRPWTAIFLTELARAHDVEFHRPIVVSSAVRTVAYQKKLDRVNGNAAPAEGDIVSPHLTGGTIDIAKGDLPRVELRWMRAWLAPLQAAGKIDVEEEFQQSCFHITVYQNYEPPAPSAPSLAARKPGARPKARRRHSSIATALAARVM